MKRDLQLDLDSGITLPGAERARQWRHALPLLGFALVSIIAWHASTAMSMADTWNRNETFAHGYIVPLISVWLAWRKRDELASVLPRPSWWALAPIALTGFAWLLGELAAVNVLSQLALTAMFVLTVVTVLGKEV